MIILNVFSTTKEILVLFLDSFQEMLNSRRKIYISCRTGKQADKIEIEFLNWYISALLHILNLIKY